MEVTCRTLQSRLLLRPSRELNEIIVGILARAKTMYEVQLCAFVFLSNHFHIIAWVEDARQLSRFMGYVNSNLAREAGRLIGWREKFWARRYQAILISAEESAQMERLAYILSNGPKEGLVAQPQDWPGVHCIDSLLGGEPLVGYWFDRTREYAARNRREDFDRLQFASRETLTLDPLPCWRGLTQDQIGKRVTGLLSRVQAETERARKGAPPLGPEAILEEDPHSKPQHSKKSPAPFCHAVAQTARRELWEAYSRFVEAFRPAAEKLRRRDFTARFPAGSFPPAQPFISAC